MFMAQGFIDITHFSPAGPGTPGSFNNFEGNGTTDGVSGFQSAATDFLNAVSMANMTPPTSMESHPLRHPDGPVPSPSHNNPGTPGSTASNMPPTSMTPMCNSTSNTTSNNQPLNHGLSSPSPAANNNQSSNSNSNADNNANNNQLSQHNNSDLGNDLNFDPAAIIEGEDQGQEGLDVSVPLILSQSMLLPSVTQSCPVIHEAVCHPSEKRSTVYITCFCLAFY